MGSRKGFMHLVEIVIISIVMFAVLFQFFSLPRPSSDWNKAKMRLQGNDLFFVLQGAGIDWLDANGVEGNMSDLLNYTGLVYDVQVKNAIKSQIRVGCMCNDQQFQEVSSLLQGFTVNGQSVEFVTEQADAQNAAFPLAYDVIVLWDTSLAGFETQAGDYLKEEKGVVEIRDFTAGEQVDSVQQNLFGLSWDPNTVPGSGSIKFTPYAQDLTSRFSNIYKYFLHIPNSSGSFMEPDHRFSSFLSPSEHVGQKSGLEDYVLLRQDGTSAPALIVNDRVLDGKGRTAWLSNGSFAAGTGDMGVLLRSLVAWAAGDTYYVVPEQNPMSPIELHFYTSVERPPNPMYQPIEVVLTLGFVY